MRLILQNVPRPQVVNRASYRSVPLLSRLRMIAESCPLVGTVDLTASEFSQLCEELQRTHPGSYDEPLIFPPTNVYGLKLTFPALPVPEKKIDRIRQKMGAHFSRLLSDKPED